MIIVFGVEGRSFMHKHFSAPDPNKMHGSGNVRNIWKKPCPISHHRKNPADITC